MAADDGGDEGVEIEGVTGAGVAGEGVAVEEGAGRGVTFTGATTLGFSEPDGVPVVGEVAVLGDAEGVPVVGEVAVLGDAEGVPIDGAGGVVEVAGAGTSVAWNGGGSTCPPPGVGGSA